MNEEEETQEVQETVEGESTEETASVVERAEQTAKRLKEENDRAEELIQRKEDAQAREALGGKSEAGHVPEKKVETDEEYAERFESGQIDLTKP